MKQYAPKIQVLHYGVVSGTGDRDLTGWLGEGCTVRTSKSIRAPMGQFAITFADKIVDPGFLDSVYALFAPMDAVEIRMAHDGSNPLKLVMRGFVSDVRRIKEIGQDGKPIRRVMVIGHDVGKLLLMHHIYVLHNAKEAGLALNAWGVLVKYFGAVAKWLTAAEYFTAMTSALQDHLNILLAESRLKIKLTPLPEIEGLLPPQVINSVNDVSYHQYMSKMLDVGSFNEMFTRDDEGGASFIIRPNLTQDVGITFTEDDVRSSAVHRSDANVANWYRVHISRAEYYDHATSWLQWERTGSTIDMRGFETCSEAKYGWRKMEVDVSLFPPNHGLQDAPQLEQAMANQSLLYPWLAARQQTLSNINVYNAELEDGQFVISGNEHAIPGKFVTYKEGQTEQEYYCFAVEHEFAVYGNYTTTLHCDRGTGYVMRMAGGQYRPELNLKGAQK